MVPSATGTSDSSSRSFRVSPDQSTTSFLSNETAISAISGIPTSSTSSSPSNVTSSTSNITPTPTPTSSLITNTTLASHESTLAASSSQSTTSITYGTTTSSLSNVSSTTTTTLRSTTTIWSPPPFNVSCSYLTGSGCGPYNATAPAWATGRPSNGPLWTNVSSPAWGYTLPLETDTSSEGGGTVITITIEATPAPITPSPITPPPEEITVTAIVPENYNHTSSSTSGQGTTLLSGTGFETSAIWPAESAPITMTIVIGSNVTSVVSESQPLVSTTSPSNSSIVSAVSNPAATSGSGSQGASLTASESSTINATTTSTGSSPSNSTVTGSFNATTASAPGGNSGLPPASITSSPYWTNATSGTPCSLTPSYLWQDWNWTAPSAPTSAGNSDTANSTSTSTGSPARMSQPTAVSSSNATTNQPTPPSSTDTSPTGDNSTITSAGPPVGILPTPIPPASGQQTNGTAIPTTGDWFALSTFGDGSVLTTFVTHFGPAFSTSSEFGYNAAISSPSPVGHHIVVPPKKMAAWAKMDDV
ncbi:hypothetical protein AYL99_03194 [Fonsecaea erecta]|uniref:Uncharacterized protein n=1 Tax=Fonsecaea erecta TaxID=1367422 RepID=A0A178ZW65_9EURO|nr:hypothetical protein AYL99_03194 [Fonsecaea erecta]OAP63967.1 hypothetical protein AYL99_03194 [Fonsecaea erecta]